MLFVDALKNNLDGNSVLLYGSVTDCFLSKDLCFREFRVVLHSILKECGYENIVFYDFTTANGKYVLDDDSAYYSIVSAKDPYEKKYGGPPKVRNNTGGLPPKVPTAQSTGQINPVVPSMPGGRRFGHQPKVVGSAPAPQVSPSPATPFAGSVANAGQEIPHVQRNLDPAIFYEELNRMMGNDEIRTAFVFDLRAFLNDPASLRNIRNITYEWRHTQNHIIFVNTLGGRIFRDETILRAMYQCGLFQYFCTEDANGNPTYLTSRCFPILDLQRDEILYLLQRLRLFYPIEYRDGIMDATDRINYLLQSSNQPITLRSLWNRAERFVKISPTVLGDEFYAEVSKKDMSVIDFHPLETLCSRPGWEEASHLLVDKLVPLCEHINGETCQVTDFPGKVRWLSTRPHASVVTEEKTVSTQRFGGTLKNEYPNATVLPHMMLVGSPGTGKTTAANALGQALHEAGLLSSGHVVTVDGGSLQGGYIGQTPIRVNEYLDRAENGVLFIDEAYNLCKDYDKPGNSSTFSEEAVNTLVNAMTDPNRHVLVIFAGYPSDNPNDREDRNSVRGLYRMNAGLSRRIVLELEISDYTPDVLTEIFLQELEVQGYCLGANLTRQNIESYMSYHYQTRTNRFGNGKFAKDAALACIARARQRLGNEIIPDDFGSKSKYLTPVTMSSVEAELLNYPGLHDLGMDIIQKTVRLYENRKLVGIRDLGSPNHLILVGKRGTGKTTLAKLLCKAWGTAGIMSGRPPVIIQHPGSCTSDELKTAISRSMQERTALFIDEAHRLPERLLAELLNPMSEYQNLTCIFALYPEEEEHFYAMDLGLRDRCMPAYHIEDYTPSQLTEIFKSMARARNREVDDSCLKALQVWFENTYETRNGDPHYSNARMVERIVETMEATTSERVFQVEHIPAEMRDVIAIREHKHSFEEILAKFDDYVGWNTLKMYLRDTKNLLEYRKVNPRTPLTFGHLLFAGNPGTGKTSAGALFAEACYSLGLIRTSRFLKYDVQDLVGQYMGETRQKTLHALQRGIDGVIMIDEAYNLSFSSHTGSSYEREAVDVLLTFSEEQSGKTLIILAGYEDRLNRFISLNPGLGSRFSKTIRFRNFSPAECRDILRNMLHKGGAFVELTALSEAEQLFGVCINKYDNWGNARAVRNIYDSILKYHAERIVSTRNPVDTVTVEDIQAGFERWERDLISSR